MASANRITEIKLSKNEVMNELHQLTIAGIRLIAKNDDKADMEFEQYFLSMLELQTRPFSNEECSSIGA